MLYVNLVQTRYDLSGIDIFISSLIRMHAKGLWIVIPDSRNGILHYHKTFAAFLAAPVGEGGLDLDFDNPPRSRKRWVDAIRNHYSASARKLKGILFGTAQVNVPIERAAKAAEQCHAAGMTQQEIADKMGVSRQRVNQILSASSSDNLSEELAPPKETIEQEVKRRGVSKRNVDTERKLKSEFPAIWARLQDEADTDISTLNKAAIEAGFRKKTFSVPEGDVEAVVKRLLSHGYDANELITELLRPRQ